MSLYYKGARLLSSWVSLTFLLFFLRKFCKNDFYQREEAARVETFSAFWAVTCSSPSCFQSCEDLLALSLPGLHQHLCISTVMQSRFSLTNTWFAVSCLLANDFYYLSVQQDLVSPVHHTSSSAVAPGIPYNVYHLAISRTVFLQRNKLLNQEAYHFITITGFILTADC